VLRSQCVAEESSLSLAETEVDRNTDKCRPSGTDEWCCDADDWGEDLDDSSVCCANEVTASERQVSVDNLSCSDMVVSPAADAENIDASTPVQDGKPVAKTEPIDTSHDEPALLLMHLTVDEEVCTQSKTSAEVRSSSNANSELSNKSSESTSNAASELEPYYVYVIEEPAVTDQSGHVDDLLARYRLQEGSRFTTELESGNCTYVSLQRIYLKTFS